MAKKILIVDDDMRIVQIIRSRLVASGYEVTAAYDGQAGLDAVRRENPDLIILDVLMPKMDGYTFVKSLRKEPSSREVPVIVLTAKDKMRDLFIAEGVLDYMIKPYKPEDLLARISEAIG